MITLEQRATEAIRTLPLPSQSASAEENYKRFLHWVYNGKPSVASLVIDLSFDHPSASQRAIRPQSIAREGYERAYAQRQESRR